jgi:hypothetical protein
MWLDTKLNELKCNLNILFMRQFIKKLVFGKPEFNFRLQYPAIKNQRLIIKSIWNNEHHNDVSIEKIFRLILASIQFAFPAIYMRHILWKYGYMYQTIAIEIYVILKTLFPLLLLLSGLYKNKILLGVTIYLLVESLCYISALIFISDQIVKSRSYKRSILLLLIDYGMLAFDFAVIYGGFDLLGGKTKNALDYIYFSFITSATIGYGDIYPTTSLGKVIVCFQSIIFLIFVVLVINLFASRAGNELKNYDTDKDRRKT